LFGELGYVNAVREIGFQGASCTGLADIYLPRAAVLPLGNAILHVSEPMHDPTRADLDGLRKLAVVNRALNGCLVHVD
jgi:hypothetical protein